MEAFLLSTGIVALAEMGDKTQLLSLLLATRFKRPWPIVWGILLATLLNHALAGAVGAWAMAAAGPDVMRWVLGILFMAMALWLLIPDKIDADAALPSRHWGVFFFTTWTFFLAEMGDKTQIATVALGAQFEPLLAVVVGTTLGMMLANVPVVFFGDAITRRIPIRVVHTTAALIFALLGLAVLLGLGW